MRRALLAHRQRSQFRVPFLEFNTILRQCEVCLAVLLPEDSAGPSGLAIRQKVPKRPHVDCIGPVLGYLGEVVEALDARAVLVRAWGFLFCYVFLRFRYLFLRNSYLRASSQFLFWVDHLWFIAATAHRGHELLM